MKVNQWISEFHNLIAIDNRETLARYMPALPRLIAADGFSMSIQAGFYVWATPRFDFAYYEEVEIGFPSAVQKTLLPYVDITCDVFGYVPIKIVNKIIRKHGGVPDNNLLEAKIEYIARAKISYLASSKL